MSGARRRGMPHMSTVSIVKDITTETLKNVAMSVPPVRRRRLSRPRTSSPYTGELWQLDRYGFQLLNMVDPIVDIRGGDVLEIGPGDSLATGLSILAAGANSYTCVDRFPGDYISPTARALYLGMAEEWSARHPSRPWPEWLDPSCFPEHYGHKVTIRHSAVESFNSTSTYDVICSHQVAQHVSDLDAFAQVNARSLRRSGVAVHKIDFGPMGPWRRHTDPAEFLAVPEAIWRISTSARGGPNRERLSSFVRAFRAVGLDVQVTHVETIVSDRITGRRLAKRFRHLASDDVAIWGATLVARHIP
jgi:SAM-dependent methyltransferase